MKILKYKIAGLSLFCLVIGTNLCHAQQGSVTVNQDPRVDALLAIKKDMNRSESASGRYKIQIYSGNRFSAEEKKSSFNKSVGKWSSKMVYETPNYKIWVGDFRTRLEADRALKNIKRKFSGAFIFKPKKKK